MVKFWEFRLTYRNAFFGSGVYRVKEGNLENALKDILKSAKIEDVKNLLLLEIAE